MNPLTHVGISSVAGLAISYWTHSPQAGVACLIGGVLIDLDHHLDYFIARKKIPWTIDDIKDYYDRDKQGKVYLMFHSYELLFLLWFIAYQLPTWNFLIGFLFGATIHLLCDQFVNPLRPFSYFLSYRIKVGFEKKYLYTPEFYARHT